MLGKILETDDGNILGSTDGLEERTELGSSDSYFDGSKLGWSHSTESVNVPFVAAKPVTRTIYFFVSTASNVIKLK